jgi:glycerol-3-phosphate O-acyltransferase/dihydroxyacetone phosphate acyltransferase
LNFFTHLYKFIKWLTITSLRIYYPDTTIVNRKNLKHKRPGILVSNHPNTLIDPLIAAKEIPMIVHFLANAGLFKTRFQNWLFNKLYCIPIERPEDVGGRPLQNQRSFARCDNFLGNGGCLYIAPEGTSYVERTLRPIKTGTARIALSAAKKKNFDLDLYISPVGINYEALNYFRTKVFVNVGEPIRVKDYQTQYELNPVAAARQLTNDLEEELLRLLISTKDEEEDRLLRQLELLAQHEQPLDAEQHFLRTKKTLRALRSQAQENPDAYRQLISQADAYFYKLQQLKTADRAVRKKPGHGLKDYAGLIAGFPVFLLGGVSHLIPVSIILWLVRKLNLYVGYNTTAKMLSGLVFLPIFYVLQTYLVYLAIGLIPALLYLLTIYPTGSYAWKWYKNYEKYKEDMRARPAREALLQQREELTQAIEDFLKVPLNG